VNFVESIVAMAVYANDNPFWVEQAIASISQQTYRNFIFVIVIDGPVNPSLLGGIMSAANRDDRIVVLELEENSGLASSMNVAIDWSLALQPSFFFRMDADDISEPQRLMKQVDYLHQHPDVSVLGAGLIEINENNVKVGARVMPLTHKRIIRSLPRRCTINHPTVAIRYSVFTAGFRYLDGIRNTQDYFLWIELAAKGYIFCNLEDKLLKFRRVDDFYKRRGFSKSINEFKARFLAMYKLKRITFYNVLYANMVLILRLMPAKIVKMAYKLDRHMLEKFVRH
jgi:glycosyltransferase involved in cell wall biosynthesis